MSANAARRRARSARLVESLARTERVEVVLVDEHGELSHDAGLYAEDVDR
jgi:hypothetical protein